MATIGMESTWRDKLFEAVANMVGVLVAMANKAKM
jgi:hypothetical protein